MTRIALALVLALAVAGAGWLMALLAVGLVGPKSRPVQVGAGEMTVEAGGTRMRCRFRDGAGPTLVLLHGFAGSLDDWDAVIDSLPGRRIYAVDLPGFGGSDRPESPYDLETMSRYLTCLLDEVAVDEAVLVGFSMGGSIAAWTAAESPDRVAAVALIAPSAFPGSLTPSFPAQPLYRPGLANRLTAALVSNPIFRRLFPSSLVPQVLGVTASYDDRFADSLEEIHQPVLLIWSETDTTARFRFAEEYRRRIPDLFLAVAAPSAGHSVLSRDASATAERIDDFLRRRVDGTRT